MCLKLIWPSVEVWLVSNVMIIAFWNAVLWQVDVNVKLFSAALCLEIFLHRSWIRNCESCELEAQLSNQLLRSRFKYFVDMDKMYIEVQMYLCSGLLAFYQCPWVCEVDELK